MWCIARLNFHLLHAKFHSFLFFFLGLNKLELRVPYRNIPNSDTFTTSQLIFSGKQIFAELFQGLKIWERVRPSDSNHKNQWFGALGHLFLTKSLLSEVRAAGPNFGHHIYFFFCPEIAPAGLISDSFQKN